MRSQGLVLCSTIPEPPRHCFHVCRSRQTCSLLWKPDVIVMFVGHARRVGCCGSGTLAWSCCRNRCTSTARSCRENTFWTLSRSTRETDVLHMPSGFACATVFANCTYLKTSTPASGCQQRSHRQRDASCGC